MLTVLPYTDEKSSNEDRPDYSANIPCYTGLAVSGQDSTQLCKLIQLSRRIEP